MFVEMKTEDDVLRDDDLVGNPRAAHLAEKLEAAYGIPLYDSVSTGVWKSLSVAGVDAARVTGWGSLQVMSRSARCAGRQGIPAPGLACQCAIHPSLKL